MDPKVAEKFAQALADCAVRQDNVALRKEAAAYQLVKQAEGDLRASPYIYGPAIGALLGGAGGYFSDDDEKKKLRNILYGAGIGGLSGLGIAGLGDAASRYFAAAPGAAAASAAAPGAPASDKKDAPKSDNKPAAKSETSGRAKTDPYTASATVGGGAAGAVVGGAVGGRHRYSVGQAAKEVAAAPSAAGRLMGAKQPTTAQQAIAERMARLQNYLDQAGGLRRITDAQLIQNAGLPAATPPAVATRLRSVLTGRANHAEIAEALAQIEAANPPPGRRGQPGRPRFDASDVPASVVNAGRGGIRTKVRGGAAGIAGGVLGGWGANELSRARVPEAVGDTIGAWLENWRKSQ